MLLGAGLALGCTRSTAAPTTNSATAPPVAPTGTSSPPTQTVAGPSELLDFASFRPLLAEADLSECPGKLELEPSAARLTCIGKAAAAPNLSPLATARREYLLASLLERSGDQRQAAEVFQRAGGRTWALSQHALLRAARAWLGAGEAELAFKQWQRLSPFSAQEALAQATLARIQRARGELAAAVATWETLASLEPQFRALFPPERRTVILALGELEQQVSPGKLDLIVAQARAVRLEFPADDELRRATERLANVAWGKQGQPKSGPRSEMSLEVAERLVDGRNWKAADEELAHVEALKGELTELGCRWQFLKARTDAARKRQPDASDGFIRIARDCSVVSDLQARALFSLAGIQQAQGQRETALATYEQLETRFPKHRLADDTRIKRASLELDRGNEARFTELLASLLDDYPEGDLSADGVFQLATRRMVRSDWLGAEQLLLAIQKAPSLAKLKRIERQRLDYFLARIAEARGDRARAIAGYVELVEHYPLSYYMLLAQARLAALDPAAAPAARARGVAKAEQGEFRLALPANARRETCETALELLGIGELEQGTKLLEQAGLDPAGTAEAVWALVSLSLRAGATRSAVVLAKSRLEDWPTRWPSGGWSQAWQLAFPRPYHATVAQEARNSGVSEALIYAIMREESEFEPSAESPAAAYGLMQLIIPTARTAARGTGLVPTTSSLKQPSLNIALGSRVLRGLLDRFAQIPELAIPGYNAGPGRPIRWQKEYPGLSFDLWVEAIPYLETRNYTKRVLASRATYAWLYETGQLDTALTLPLTVPP